jgi:hypothetical protein
MHVNAARFGEIEAPSAGEVQIERPREHPPGALRPVGRRAQLLHVFIDVRKLRLDRSFAPLSRAIPGRVRFHDFCRSMFQRALPWTARTSRTIGIRGRDGCQLDRSLPFDRRRPPRLLRVRGRGSPSLGAPSRDCSRKRLRPNPDRLRHLVSRALSVTLSGVDEGTDEAADAAHASKA